MRTYVFLASLMLVACTQVEDSRPYQNNAELTNLFKTDQAERSGVIKDWNIVVENDRKRRQRVLELIEVDSLVTANDYYHAAMVFQHGNDSLAYKRAWELAERAVSIDSTHSSARRLTAAAADRYLLSINERQIYGTQFMIYLNVWYLQPIDTAAVSDAERRLKGTRTLKEIEALLEEKNGENRGLNILPDSVRAAMRQL